MFSITSNYNPVFIRLCVLVFPRFNVLSVRVCVQFKCRPSVGAAAIAAPVGMTTAPPVASIGLHHCETITATAATATTKTNTTTTTTAQMHQDWTRRSRLQPTSTYYKWPCRSICGHSSLEHSTHRHRHGHAKPMMRRWPMMRWIALPRITTHLTTHTHSHPFKNTRMLTHIHI